MPATRIVPWLGVAVLAFVLGFALAKPALALHNHVTYKFSPNGNPNNTFVNRWWVFHNADPIVREIRWWTSSANANPVVAHFETILPEYCTGNCPTGGQFQANESSGQTSLAGDRYINIKEAVSQAGFGNACPADPPDSGGCMNPVPYWDDEYRDGLYLNVSNITLNDWTYDFTTNGYRAVTAHELGHYFGLDHYNNGGDISTSSSTMGAALVTGGNLITKMSEWADGTWGTTANDRTDIRDFYSLYTPGANFTPSVSGHTVTFQWWDYTYTEKNYLLQIYNGYPDDQVADTWVADIYSQADVADRGQVLSKVWTAPSDSTAKPYYAVLSAINAVYGFGPTEDTPAAIVYP